jgi:hypothetical protein
MLDLRAHFVALDVLRARLKREVSSGAMNDGRAVDALDALETHYDYAVLGAVVDHLLAHAGPSDTEVALLAEAEALYVEVRAFLLDFRAVRQRLEALAEHPLAPTALSDYNAIRGDLGDLAGRYEPLVAKLQAYAWKLRPLHHLVQQPLHLDPPVKDWPWRVLLNFDDGYEGMSFGDGGALAIVGPASDLAEGRYDRLVSEPSMAEPPSGG